MKPKVGDVREDGRIWWGGRWRTPEAVKQYKENLDNYTRANRERINQKQREKYHANLEYQAQRRQEYRARNAERIREKAREYRETNRERCRAAYRAYYHRNKEKIIQKSAKYHSQHTDQCRETARRYYHRHAEEISQKRASKRKSDPEKFREYSLKYYYDNHETVLQRCREKYLANTPAAGLRDTISQFRSGAITIDELNRRYDEAIKRADALVSRRSKTGGKPV